tara:strand:+ start:673 stop:1569 length:897 start_codon:yes stop_codon:yes gene_type:complete
MSSDKVWKVTLIKKPIFRLDLSNINWNQFTEANGAGEWSNFFILDGVNKKPFNDFFSVQKVTYYSDDEFCSSYDFEDITNMRDLKKKIIFEGNMSDVDFLGFGNDGVHMLVNGNIGNYTGCLMKTGSITIKGSAGHFIGAMMSGGNLTINGNVGHYAGSNLTGEMQGMSGGHLVVKGNAGNSFGRRMRRGFAFVSGDVGDFFANDMIAGSAIIGGKAGRFWGYGMRRGTIVFAKDQEIPVQVFKETNYDFTSYWGLMRPTIESFNGPMQSFLDKTPRRFVGDLAFGGKGECLLPPKTI